MHDPTDDDDIDRAYCTAVETTTDVAAVKRRRAAILEAVAALDVTHEAPIDQQVAAPGDRPAANDAQRHSSATWWRGVAAACVIGASALVVVRMQQVPDARVETGLRSAADPVAALAPAGESTAARLAETAPHQSGVPTVAETAPGPLPAPVPAPNPAPKIAPAPASITDATRRAPMAPETAATGARSTTALDPVAKAERSAFPGDSVDATLSTGRVAQADAAAAATDASPREDAVAGLPSTLNRVLDPKGRQERSTSRTESTLAGSREALGAAVALPPSRSAVAVGNALAKNSPARDNAARAGEAAERAPGKDLLVAVNQGDVEAVRTILLTTNPDAERDADGRTALAIAVLRTNVPLVKLLLASGANRSAADRFGHTPVSYANASADKALLKAFETR